MANTRGSKRTRKHWPARSRHGELTLGDVEWLAEHSELPARVIKTLTDVVTARETGQTDDAPDAGATKGAVELARAESIGLADVEGTGRRGPDGRRKVTLADVKRAASPATAA
jgi:hypothetical protein